MAHYCQLEFSQQALWLARAIRFEDLTEALAQTTPMTTASILFVAEFGRFQLSLNFSMHKHWLAMDSNLGLSSCFPAPPLLSNKGHAPKSPAVVD